MSENRLRIFNWLGDSYLAPLNLMWSEAGAEADLERFRDAALRLSGEPDYWRYLFRCGAWREQLAALTCALVSSARDYGGEFRDAIRGGSWVSPQLVVSLSLLHPDLAREWISSEADSPWLADQLKTLGALCAARSHLLLPPIPPPVFSTVLEPDEFGVGVSTATSHFAFWRSRIQA